MRAFLLLLLSFTASAEDIDLATALERANLGNLELKAQRFQEVQSAADIRRVHGEFGPRIELLVGGAPITKATGNVLVTVEDKSTIGRIFVGKFSVTQPLYTWGRWAAYRDAAKSGQVVKESESEQKWIDVRYSIKEAYFGFQLANSLQDFIAGGKEELTKAIEGRKKKKGNTAKEDYKLEIFLREVEAREAEVMKYYQLAQEGFALRVGADRGTISPKEKWLIPVAREKKKVEDYISLAKEERPEFRQIQEGINAKSLLAKAELRARYPMLAFLASYDFADTNVRTIQRGVFAYDPYNKSTVTLGLGFKLDFQWGLQESKAAKFQAEADEIATKGAFANQGIATEVRRAYLELEEAEKRLAAATAAYKTGKKWLTGEVMGYGSGLGNTSGLVEAYGARAETAKNYFDAVYHHHLAWATLSKAVGTEVDPAISAL